jgi:hypothetical protein
MDVAIKVQNLRVNMVIEGISYEKSVLCLEAQEALLEIDD